jgi:F-type H+/Na+-transporting ATPase subunit beta
MKTTIVTIPVGEALLGRVIDAAGEPLDSHGPLAEADRLPLDQLVGADAAPLPDQLFETGIKVIDLYAPIVRGGTISMIAGSGVGKIVVSIELLQRVVARRGGCAVLAIPDSPTYGMAELVADLRGSGMDIHTTLVVGQPDDPRTACDRAGLAALTLAEYFRDQGRETLLFVDENLISNKTVDRFLTRRRGGANAALTMLVWQHDPPIGDSDGPADSLLRDHDGRLAFSRDLAKQSIWPAVDPLNSTSRLLDGQVLGPEHVRVARAARELLHGYASLEGAGTAGDDEGLRARARRVLLFQSQPFVVAETFTAVPGVYISVEETVRGFGELVAGRHDAVPEEAFRFTGTLDEALSKAAV